MPEHIRVPTLPRYENIEEKLRGVGAQIRRIGELLPRRVSAPAVAS